ncbi:cytochrome-c oxidase, cbb3-type subunit III [Croceibacterium sp. LX-88]|uniref:Cbb3-type cytochrome c oxidase subunit n=1 Tax=Croceibacterium selenioxidans TaxID=2838833 RepID=A0ABS5W0Q3_9SPHN|nr:cytochrome-c oxidase, cbb3-type subunit III [Croceibacterium selenioxidans]MBT2132823.1 cytochrome-c oxidase, cbb3-type subunit III [Croceibacterium selenioxidans]
MANRRLDEATGTETVGHEWDGIEELDTPMPRWWLWTFFATVLFAIGYTIAYPAWPLVEKGTEGVLGWTSRGDFDREMQLERDGRAALFAQLATTPIERLPDDPALMRAAVSGGRAAFKVNCVQCHGSGAAGSAGYPNLNDDDWLWGGDLKTIEYTLLHGIRQPGVDATRTSLMPAFGGALSADQIAQVTDHIMSLSGKSKGDAAGAQLFADNCAACHGPAGTGNRELGAPNLADAIWLYGGTRESIGQQIRQPRHGVMPAWKHRLDPVTVRMLAAYVHSLGGGEQFLEVAANAADQADEQR